MKKQKLQIEKGQRREKDVTWERGRKEKTQITAKHVKERALTSWVQAFLTKETCESPGIMFKIMCVCVCVWWRTDKMYIFTECAHFLRIG